MARTADFGYKNTSQGWVVNIPASLSDSGRRRRRYFPTRDEAKAECQRLRELSLRRDQKAVDIRHSLAEDATTAAAVLSRFGVTLTQAAKFYELHHDTRAKAPILSEAWDAAIERRPNHRPRTLADFKSWKKALPDWLMAMNTHDIGAKKIEKALDETTKGPTRWKSGLRYLSTVLGDCVKAGTLRENPAKSVHIRRSKDDAGEVSTYTPDELRAVLNACKDYPLGTKDRLCSKCVIPFAVMAFAGVRPDEVARLTWEDISTELENIRIGPKIAKKARRRNVRINATLAAWIATIPKEDRKGKLVPPRWRFKAARVRREAGIDGHEMQDALRHSFGTYLLATENDLDALKSDMGHEHVRVYFDHYHKAVAMREALPYWKVLPKGVKILDIEVA